MNRATAERIARALTAALLIVSGAEGAGQKNAQDLSGRWTLTTSAEGPHGAISMALVLTQAGEKVTGTLAPPHGGEIALAGEFVNGTLTLTEASDEGLTMSATLREDGTLTGYLSSARGDLTWTAQRVKARE